MLFGLLPTLYLVWYAATESSKASTAGGGFLRADATTDE